MQSTVHIVRSISSSDGGDGSSVAYVDKYEDSCENNPVSLTGSGFLAGRTGLSLSGMGEIHGNDGANGEKDFGRSPLTNNVTRIRTIYIKKGFKIGVLRISSPFEFHPPCPHREKRERQWPAGP